MRDVELLLPALVSLVIASSVSLGATPSRSALGDLCTGGMASGTGLRAAYYSPATENSLPALIRLDAGVSSASVRAVPDLRSSAAPVRVLWCGWIRPVVTGPHHFSANGGRLSVEIANQPGLTEPGASPLQLKAGKPYAIRIELEDATDAGEFVLQWTPPFGITYDVPPTVLYPPVETTSTGC